jgi:hypothetical protein
LIENLQDETYGHFKNISYLKQERSSLESRFDSDLWTEHNKWVDISQAGKRHERLKALYAEENINKNKFPDAFSNLQQSKNL